MIGPLWAIWHLPSMLVVGQGAHPVLWGLSATVAVRIINVRMYNNSGASVFAVILTHAVGSTARTGYPGGRAGYELGSGAVAYSIIMLFALSVVILWQPATLSRFLGRGAKKATA